MAVAVHGPAGVRSVAQNPIRASLRTCVSYRVARQWPSAALGPITSVHESVTADRVLKHMRERRSHQVLVVDEFGGTAGLLSLEDVLSELLGDVGDEFKPGEPVPETLPDGSMRLPGAMGVADAAVLLRTDWNEKDANTVGGLVTAELGHLPAPGEQATVGDVELTVERVVGHAIETVLARRREQERPMEGEA